MVSSTSGKQITLVTSDEVQFKVDIDVAKCSKTIKDMLDNLGMEDEDDTPIPVTQVDSKTLEKVLEWCKHHKDDPEPEPEDEYRKDKDKRDDLFSTWDADFIRVDENTIFELTLAANFLDIDGLLDLTCKVIANMLRGKTPEWCRERFGIVNDFTPEEEEQIRKENEWCEDK